MALCCHGTSKKGKGKAMYFNLNDPPSTQPPQQADAPASLSIGMQALLYFGALLGVILSDPVLNFIDGEAARLEFSWTILLISAALALVILPAAAAAVNNAAPVLIQFALYFQHGVFWRLVAGAVQDGLVPGQ